MQWEWKPLQGYTNNGQIYICTWIVFNSVMTKISIKRSADWKCKFSPRLLMNFWETPSGQALWAVHGTEMLNTMVNLSFFFILFFLILIMCQYIIIICFICVRDVVKPYKIHTKIIWEFIEALPDFLIWKASELKWNFQLILASSKYACFLALLTHKREFSEWAFRVLVGVYDCLWSAILLSFSINGQMSVELTF